MDNPIDLTSANNLSNLLQLLATQDKRISKMEAEMEFNCKIDHVKCNNCSTKNEANKNLIIVVQDLASQLVKISDKLGQDIRSSLNNFEILLSKQKTYNIVTDEIFTNAKISNRSAYEDNKANYIISNDLVDENESIDEAISGDNFDQYDEQQNMMLYKTEPLFGLRKDIKLEYDTSDLVTEPSKKLAKFDSIMGMQQNSSIEMSLYKEFQNDFNQTTKSNMTNLRSNMEILDNTKPEEKIDTQPDTNSKINSFIDDLGITRFDYIDIKLKKCYGLKRSLVYFLLTIPMLLLFLHQLMLLPSVVLQY